MKPGVTCYTDPDQPDEAMRVLSRQGREVGAEVVMAPKLNMFDWGRYVVPCLL